MKSTLVSMLVLNALFTSILSHSASAQLGEPRIPPRPARAEPTPAPKGSPPASLAQPRIKQIARPSASAARPAGDKPDLLADPLVDTPEWYKRQADDERREKELSRVINGICRGC